MAAKVKEPQPGDDDYENWFNVMAKEAMESKEIISMCFDDIVDNLAPVLIPLRGENYKSVIKASIYTGLSTQLVNIRYRLDGKVYDFRIPLLLMLRAGYGKKEIENYFRQTMRGLNKTYIEPDSYNPEQFVGKIMIEDHGKKGYTYEPSYGFLSKDFILVDDSYELLTSKSSKHTETLRHMRKALDPIDYNPVTKSRVDALQEEILYYPHCNVVLLSQPLYKIDEKLLMHGTLRRFNIVIPTIPRGERSTARINSKFDAELLQNISEENIKDSWSMWLKLNVKLQNPNITFTGNHISDIIDEYINEIILKVENGKSREVKQYTESLEFNLKHTIFKMASIRAVIESTKDIIEIQKYHLMEAIADHRIWWNTQVLWVSQQMELESGLPSGWKEDTHLWILQKLIKDGDHYKTKIIDRYVKKYEKTYAVNTLKKYIYQSIRDLIKWQLIKEYVETPANDKLLRITDMGKQYL